MVIREFCREDERALYAVFYCAIHGLAAQDYTAEQLGVWAPMVVDPERWAQRMRGIRPFVAEDDGGIIVGYADLQVHGYTITSSSRENTPAAALVAS